MPTQGRHLGNAPANSPKNFRKKSLGDDGNIPYPSRLTDGTTHQETLGNKHRNAIVTMTITQSLSSVQNNCTKNLTAEATLAKARAARLLTALQAMAVLGISSAQFYRYLSRLKAKGMRAVLLPSSIPGKPPVVRYDRTSLDEMIDRAGRRGEPLI